MHMQSFKSKLRNLIEAYPFHSEMVLKLIKLYLVLAITPARAITGSAVCIRGEVNYGFS